MTLARRQLLKALGLGALGGVLDLPRARAAEKPPLRIVFFIQPHGHVPGAWTMPIPDGPSDALAERSLLGLKPEDFSQVLRPLHAFRDRLLVVEGLSHTTVQADVVDAHARGLDFNNHNVAIAGLLTCASALQHQGSPCTGGARSLDQELALRLAGDGRFASRQYGTTYFVNQGRFPFSFLEPGKPTPMVSDPQAAFADLMARATPGGGGGTRAEKLAALRGSVLDAAASEYEALAPRLDREGRAKLEAHRALVRDLEKSLSVSRPAECALTLDSSDGDITSFMRVIRMALACDLTRVVTFVAEVPECPAFGYPADANVHASYAHASIKGATSCGQAYSETAERAMSDLGAWYAGHFATLLEELDSVPEGSGTLLDHTLVVWLTELGTPTHQHHDVFSLIAGGTDVLRTGRYVRYPRTLPNTLDGGPRTGPAQSKLFVSLMRALDQPDESFGMKTARAADGTTLTLTGALPELLKR